MQAQITGQLLKLSQHTHVTLEQHGCDLRTCTYMLSVCNKYSAALTTARSITELTT